MAQDIKHSYSGTRKTSGGFKAANMNKSIFAGTRQKRKVRKKGK